MDKYLERIEALKTKCRQIETKKDKISDEYIYHITRLNNAKTTDNKINDLLIELSKTNNKLTSDNTKMSKINKILLYSLIFLAPASIALLLNKYMIMFGIGILLSSLSLVVSKVLNFKLKDNKEKIKVNRSTIVLKEKERDRNQKMLEKLKMTEPEIKERLDTIVHQSIDVKTQLISLRKEREEAIKEVSSSEAFSELLNEKYSSDITRAKVKKYTI